MYIHSNIPEESFNYKEALLSSVYFGVSLINGRLAKAPTDKLIKNMVGARIFGSEQFIRDMFSY